MAREIGENLPKKGKIYRKSLKFRPGKIKKPPGKRR
jgi:hypothetical protein